MKSILIFSPYVFQNYGHGFDYINGLTGAAVSHPEFDIHVLGFDGPFAAKLPTKITCHLHHQKDVGKSKGTSMVEQVAWGLRRVAQFRNLVQDALDLSARLNVSGILFESFEYFSLARQIDRFRFPTRCIFHDTSFNTKQTSISAAIYKKAVAPCARRIVRRCERTFVHGSAMRENLSSSLRIDSELAARIVPIPYGAGLPTEFRQIGCNEARSLLGISETGGPILLAFGTLRKDKEFPMLLRAIAQATSWRLLIAGPEGDMSFTEIETRIRDLKIDRRVILRKGFITSEEQPLYFGAADAVAGIYSTSIRHESGTSQLARAFLKPIVASGPPDLVEYVESNGVGWAIPFHTEKGIAATLFEAETISDSQRADLRNRINKCAEERSWSRVFGEIFKSW